MMRTTRFFILLAAMVLLYSKAHAQLEITTLRLTDGIGDAAIKMKIESNTSLLLTAMGKAVMEGTTPDLTNIVITEDAKQTLLSIWATSSMVCPISSVAEKCLVRPQGGYQVRNIPITMLAAEKTEEKQDMVLNFTANGTIDDIFIAIEENQYTQILQNNISIKDFARRQRIIDIVEQFRTAYDEKDVDFMEKIFSNNALIITGKVIKEKPNSTEMINTLDKEKIVYATQTKAQYLKKLQTVFAVNSYINVNFEELEVMAHPKYPEVYGVTMKQDWSSPNYSDQGFLFLLIDFRNEDEPVIHLRTWQPTMYNGRELTREEKFNIGTLPPLTR